MIESYRIALKKVVELVDDIENDKKLGEKVREYMWRHLPRVSALSISPEWVRGATPCVFVYIF